MPSSPAPTPLQYIHTCTLLRVRSRKRQRVDGGDTDRLRCQHGPHRLPWPHCPHAQVKGYPIKQCLCIPELDSLFKKINKKINSGPSHEAASTPPALSFTFNPPRGRTAPLGPPQRREWTDRGRGAASNTRRQPRHERSDGDDGGGARARDQPPDDRQDAQGVVSRVGIRLNTIRRPRGRAGVRLPELAEHRAEWLQLGCTVASSWDVP